MDRITTSPEREEQQMAKNTSVMGIYADRTTVSDAVQFLQRSGYRAADISVLASDNLSSKDFAHQKRTRAMEAAAAGAAGGAVAGAILAWLFSTQTLAVPGLTPLVAAGPLLAAFAGAGAGAALGWIVGLLAGLRITEYVAKRYTGRIRNGGILLSVHCDSPEWCTRAAKALRDTGARDISSASESAADYAQTDAPTERVPVVVPVVVPDYQETPAPQVVVVEHDVEESKK
jgi:Heat induced stress protein YflT domain/Alternative complex III, ActD subunit